KYAVSLRPLSRVVLYLKRCNLGVEEDKAFFALNSEKETYICIRFKINEAFKEAGLPVDFYKRSLT
ncbi:hypothetical protein N8891_04530, partial [Flavobacteriales bacterium]|nr:hypothetical protein [Flavobacteriales bacterium]